MAPHVDEGVDEGSCTRTIVLACSDAHSHSLLVMPGIITARTRSFSVAAANGAPRALLVICWLSARLCPGIMIADMYWQFCTEWQDRLITVDMYWQFCAEWQDRLITADMYWQFCAEWQDRPGIITLEIMRAPRADTGQWSS